MDETEFVTQRLTRDNKDLSILSNPHLTFNFRVTPPTFNYDSVLPCAAPLSLLSGRPLMALLAEYTSAEKANKMSNINLDIVIQGSFNHQILIVLKPHISQVER